tara:strand:- start:1948 stop:2145 length:198 start_codon:yes stop_codon:yes gene_type:complete
MSIYIIDITRNGEQMDHQHRSSIGQAVDYADNSAILGELVTITEGYEAADGAVDTNGVLMEYIMN